MTLPLQLDTDVIQAGLDLLRNDPLLRVQDGAVANGTPRPYLLVYAWVHIPRGADSNALDGLSRTVDVRWLLHGIGETRESATAMQQRARRQMLDQLLVLPQHPTLGFTLIEEERADQPTPPDEATGITVFDAVSVYKVRVTI